MRVLRFFFLQLAALPLIVVGLTVLVQSHFSWRSILLFPILIAAAWAAMMWAGRSDVYSSLNELVDFRSQFPDLALRPIPVSEYMLVLTNKVPQLHSKKPDEILPLTSKLQRDRLRILVRSAGPAGGARPPTLVAYASTLGAWLILADPPERLSGLGYFLLLHEIGHTAFSSFAVRFGMTIGIRNVIFSGMFLAFLAKPTRMQAIGIVVAALCWIPFAVAEQRYLRTYSRVLDEVIADRFALERCDPTWFRKYSASEITSFFSRLESGSDAIPLEEVRIRTEAFSQNLERLAQGQPLLGSGVLVPRDRWEKFEGFFLITLMVLIGLTHARLSYGHLAVLATVSVLSVCLALFGGMLQTMERDLADDIMGVKTIAPEKMRFLEQVYRRKKEMQSIVDWTRRHSSRPAPD